MTTSGKVAGKDGVDRALISALHSRRWSEAIDELRRENLDTHGRDRLDEAVSVTGVISKSLVDEGIKLTYQLREAGISARAVSGSSRIDGTVEVVVGPAEVGGTIVLLGALGFHPQKKMSPGAIRALPRSSSELVFVPDDSPITRLIVRWGDKRGRSRPLAALEPSLGDLASVRLPGFAWWAYWPIRLLRVARRMLLPRRYSSGSAPYVATPNDLIVPLLERVGVGSNDVVADLGCGDGRILISAVSEFGCRGIGVESDESLAALARQRVLEAGLSEKVAIESGDALSVDFSAVSVVFVFLPAAMAAKIIPQVLERLPDRARILAHEQGAVNWPVEPTDSQLVIHPAGVTVAHIWVVNRD